MPRLNQKKADAASTIKECLIYNQEWKQNLSFEENMEDFEDCVNEYLAEGWQPLGPPTFSDSWMSCDYCGGRAVQTFIREKSVEPVVVVDIPPVVFAENVRPAREFDSY